MKTPKRPSECWYVKYYDHGSSVGWRHIDEIDHVATLEENICHAIGWLLHEDKNQIVLCSFVAPVDKTCHVRTTVLKGCIISRKKIPWLSLSVNGTRR